MTHKIKYAFELAGERRKLISWRRKKRRLLNTNLIYTQSNIYSAQISWNSFGYGCVCLNRRAIPHNIRWICEIFINDSLIFIVPDRNMFFFYIFLPKKGKSYKLTQTSINFRLLSEFTDKDI